MRLTRLRQAIATIAELIVILALSVAGHDGLALQVAVDDGIIVVVELPATQKFAPIEFPD